MDFELTREQMMFRDMAKEFGLREILPSARERDREEKFPREIMKKMAHQGLLGIKIPKEHGGLGLDWITFGLVMEQISYYDFSVGISFLTQTTLQTMPILSHGDESQNGRYIPALLRGEKLGCHAAVEPNAGSDATAIETRAVRDGEEWIINGNKAWITNATVADFAIVLAQTERDKGTKGITTFIIDRDAPGFSTMKIKNKLGIRSTDTGQLFFRDCRIPDSNRLGQVGIGMRVSLGSIEHTRFGVAIGAVGVLQACIDACVKYCQERSQFGKPIGNFQLVQEKIAEMVVDCEAGRGFTRLAYLKDKGVPHSRETAITKYFCTEAAVRAARTTVELHGAYGYTDDFPVERYYRDMISPLIFGGTSNIQKLTIGSFATGIKAFV